MNISKITNLDIRTYDVAMINRLESVIQKDAQGKPLLDVIYSPYDLAFDNAVKRQKLDAKKNIRFPLIICHRSAGFSISPSTHRVLGVKVPGPDYVAYVDETSKKVTRKIQMIGVNIPYSIDIITKDEDQVFELTQELLFSLMREPYVLVPKYISNLPELNSDPTGPYFRITALLDVDIADNTDLEAESEIGKLYRVTLSIMLEDAQLYRDVTESLVESYQVDVVVTDEE